MAKNGWVLIRVVNPQSPLEPLDRDPHAATAAIPLVEMGVEMVAIPQLPSSSSVHMAEWDVPG